MHGYIAALVLKDNVKEIDVDTEINYQEKQKYIAITIKQPSTAPFRLIPNAYKILFTYIKTNSFDGR